MVAMWYTSSAQFTNSNIEHIWKDSQPIHTENIYALLGGFWHGRSFSGTGGEAKFVWCARHTWSLTLEPSVAVMSSSLCCWGVGIFSVVPGFCFLLPGRLETALGLHPSTGRKPWSRCGLETMAQLGCGPSFIWVRTDSRIHSGLKKQKLTIASCLLKGHPHRTGVLHCGREGVARVCAEV